MRLTLLVAAAMFLVGGPAARAGMVLDQSNLVLMTPPYFYGVSVGDGYRQAQTFTVGVSGTLAEVDVEVFSYGPNPGPLLVSVYATLKGNPDLSAGPLASFSVPASSVTSSGSPSVYSSPPPVVALALGTQVVPVVAGEVLAIVASAPQSSDSSYYDIAGGGNTYAGGSAYDDSGSGFQAAGGDYGFRDYVNASSVAVPEPCSAALCGLAVLAGAVARLARRRRG